MDEINGVERWAGEGCCWVGCELILIDYWSMAYQPHELSNLNLVNKYFSKLPGDDISRRYFAGEKYASSLVNRASIVLATDSYLSELGKFYPYQPLVTRTRELYEERRQKAQTAALAFSGLSIALIYSFARQGRVLPLFTKFGKFFKTHRLLRQYLWVAVAPYALATVLNNLFFVNQVEKLWTVHAERLNRRILSDPSESEYPRELLPVSQVGTWQMPFTSRYELPRKRANETEIFLAPDYAEVEEWSKVQLVDPEGEEASGEAEAEAEE